jgi:hypothetical protein
LREFLHSVCLDLYKDTAGCNRWIRLAPGIKFKDIMIGGRLRGRRERKRKLAIMWKY